MTIKENVFYFLNKDLPEKRTGIENASLLRSRVFEKELGIIPIIITASYNPRLNLQRRHLVDKQLISKNVTVINLYEYYQGTNSVKLDPNIKPLIRINKWTYQNIEGTFDYRVYDENNKKIMYRACDREGRVKYINFFYNGKKVRRDYFDSNGFLSKVQTLDKKTGRVTLETYYTIEGNVCIFKQINLENKKTELLQLVNKNGDIYASFESEESFLDYWLKEILEKDKNHYLIIDKQRVYYPVLRKWNENNIFRICCIHSSHFKQNQDYLKGEINSNYKELFEDLSNPESVVVLTNKQKGHIKGRFKDSKNIYCIPHPIETSLEKVEFEQRQLYSAIYLARLSPTKQHKSAVRMFKYVVDEIPTATLNFYGSGSKKREIKNEIKKLGLNKNIFLHDYITDVKDVYNASQVSISTSKVEGFSLFILESIEHGCPVISYDVNYGPSDMIENNYNGSLIKLNDEKNMAKNLIQLFENQDLLRKLSENAYQKSRQFSSENIASKWKTLIDDITAKKNDI